MYTILIFLFLCKIFQVFSSDYDILTKEKVYYDLNDADEIFSEYVERFHKVYDEDEYYKRLEIFKESLKEINKLNKEHNMTVFGINQFTDITYQEFTKCYTGVVGNYRKEDAIEFNTTSVPDEIDYRRQGYVTEVKDQGNCGACYVFSAIANIEGQYAKKYNQLITLSEQQGLDCEPTGDCGGGQTHLVMQALAQQGGSMKSEDYPYEQRKSTCRTDTNKIVVKVTGGNILSVNEGSLPDTLATYGPLSVYIATCPEFKAYSGGIYNINCPNNVNHAVLLVGYGTDNGTPYWLIKNSWRTVWGEQGYMRFTRGQGLCGIGTYAACATVA